MNKENSFRLSDFVQIDFFFSIRLFVRLKCISLDQSNSYLLAEQ